VWLYLVGNLSQPSHFWFGNKGFKLKETPKIEKGAWASLFVLVWVDIGGMGD